MAPACSPNNPPSTMTLWLWRPSANRSNTDPQAPTYLDQFLASALLVENRIPDGATWDGSDRPVPIREEAAVVAPVAASGGR